MIGIRIHGGKAEQRGDISIYGCRKISLASTEKLTKEDECVDRLDGHRIVTREGSEKQAPWQVSWM